MRGRVVLAVVLGAAAFVAAPIAPASPATAEVSGKGPVGWQVYRDLTAAAQLRPDAQVRQFSSFDRTGGNNDGFNNT